MNKDFADTLNKYHYDYNISQNENATVKQFLKNWKLNDKFMSVILPEMDEEAADMFTSFKEEYGKWPRLNLNGHDSIQATITVDNKSVNVDSEKYDGERMSIEFQKTCERLINDVPRGSRIGKSYKGRQDAASFDRQVQRVIRKFSVAATVAIPLVAIGGYFTWDALDDVDLNKYYDDSFKELYGDMANFNDYQTKTHVVLYSSSNGIRSAQSSTEKSNYAKAEEAYYRVKRYAKKHNMTMGDAAKKVFHSAEWKALFSTFGWSISEDEDNVYLNLNFLGRTNSSSFANHKFAFGKEESPDEAPQVTRTETYDDIPNASFSWTEGRKITKRQLFESLLRV